MRINLQNISYMCVNKCATLYKGCVFHVHFLTTWIVWKCISNLKLFTKQQKQQHLMDKINCSWIVQQHQQHQKQQNQKYQSLTTTTCINLYELKKEEDKNKRNWKTWICDLLSNWKLNEKAKFEITNGFKPENYVSNKILKNNLPLSFLFGIPSL